MKCYEPHCGYLNCNNECCHPYIKDGDKYCPISKYVIIEEEDVNDE